MSAFAAFLFALLKAIAPAEQLAAEFTAFLTNLKLERNQKDETAKNDRDDALIDAAAGKLHLCATCPFARDGGGQHGSPVAAPAVPPSGGGRS